MGAAIILANINIQELSVRTIVGSFVIILVLIGFYSLFKSNKSIKFVSFAIIVGVIIISTLIMLSLAINTVVDNFGAYL